MGRNALLIVLFASIACAGAPKPRAVDPAAHSSASTVRPEPSVPPPEPTTVQEDTAQEAPQPTGDPLAQLVRRIEDSGDWILRRASYLVDEHRFDVVVGVAAGTTWTCVTLDEAAPHCFELTLDARFSRGTSFPRLPGGGLPLLAYFVGASESEALLMRYNPMDGTMVAMGRSSADADPTPRPRAAPPFLAQLQSLDVYADGNALAAVSGANVVVCRRGTPTRCFTVSGVGGVEYGQLQIVRPHFDELWEIELVQRSGHEFATTSLLVRVGSDVARLAATVQTEGRRVGEVRSDGRRENMVLLNPLAGIAPDCLSLGPVVSRVVELRPGVPVERRTIRLPRAPERIPLEGIDPFRYDIEGSWRILDEGGLARTRSCGPRR